MSILNIAPIPSVYVFVYIYNMCIYIHIHVYIYIMCIYIYIMCIYIYVYIYNYVHLTLAVAHRLIGPTAGSWAAEEFSHCWQPPHSGDGSVQLLSVAQTWTPKVCKTMASA